MTIIDLAPARNKEKFLAGALNPVHRFLPAMVIEAWCRESEHDWRERVFGPVITVFACIWQQLKGLSSRAVEDWVLSLTLGMAAAHDGKDFCDARARLPKAVLEKSLRHVGAQCAAKAGRRFHGLPVALVDGTTLRTPRTDAHRTRWGCAKNGRGERGAPLIRVVALVCLGSGAVRDVEIGGYTEISETGLCRKLLARQSGGLLVCDAGFVSYMGLYDARTQDVHVLGALKSTRKGTLVRTLGEGDEVQLWKRPRRQDVAYWSEGCPETMEVRVITATVKRKGFRPYVIRLCTTLLDAEKYPAAELVALYCERWKIETDFRSIKTLYPLAELSGKTPEIAEKEILAGLLAYNLVQAFQCESGRDPRKISHTRSKHLLLSQSERMSAAPTSMLPEIYRMLLIAIGHCELVKQEKKPQPRKVLPRTIKYPALKSRVQWQEEYECAL